MIARVAYVGITAASCWQEERNDMISHEQRLGMPEDSGGGNEAGRLTENELVSTPASTTPPDGYLRIEQVSARTGLTKRTLRYYEEIGLLAPPTRTEGGYRLYSQDDIQHLERIKRLKDVCDLVEFLYQGKLELEVGMFSSGGKPVSPEPRQALLAVEAALDGVDESNFSVEAIEAALEKARVGRDWKKGPFYGPVRIALTAKTQTPPNFHMLAALGKERSLARLRDAIALLERAD